MTWFLLFCAGLLEVVWAYAMKRSEGFTHLGPTLITISTMIASFWLLAVSMQSLPLGTAYAVWTGIGTVGTVLLGMFLFGESADPVRLAFIAMIVIGIVGLKIVTP